VKVLVSDSMSDRCVEVLKSAPGIEVTVNTKLNPEELRDEIDKIETKVRQKTDEIAKKIVELEAQLGMSILLKALPGKEKAEIADKRKTIKMRLIKDWIMFRSDGYLKTLRNAELAVESTYRVLLVEKAIKQGLVTRKDAENDPAKVWKVVFLEAVRGRIERRTALKERKIRIKQSKEQS